MQILSMSIFVEAYMKNYPSARASDVEELIGETRRTRYKGIQDIESCIQLLYIYSGCDYVSYFKGFGKKTFFDVFMKHASFITGTETACLLDFDSESALFAFYRLISAVYFSKNSTAFLPLTSVKSLYDSLHGQNIHDKHVSLISQIREKMWERVLSEQEIMPNSEALKFHWLRSSWVFQFWAQASENFLQLSSLSDFGWKKVEQTVQWYTKGCSCKTGCTSNRCKCRKSKSGSKDGFCGPGCKCTNCVNLPDKSDTSLDISLSDISLDEISDVEIDDDDYVDVDDDDDDGDDPVQAHLFSDLDMFYLASEDL
ncbi:unnamed protein product [Mytilus coruscus]|uniref:Tesmin/TSO1-like CXC domain-containing protein n=1 Tax=Mytilus coruscus TaxID=42192 RepID=A0A6J8B1U9_MYTCO|nr:unnamed protein product [Mytilus coruscus]